MRSNGTIRVLAASVLLSAFPAWASFHFMSVVEIFPGTAAAPNAQYVVIQMYAAGQNLVGGHALTVFNASGATVGTFTFSGNVANGANQDKILIATTEAQSFFGLNADLTMPAAMLSAGGKVCWAGTIDCVSWGSYSGSTTGVGTPYHASSGLKSGKAAIRRLDISGSSTTLDAADDTNDSANDFIEGLPAPRNNARVNGTIPSATCGNGVIEGLEECDDHNLTDGDGCSSTCAITAVVPALSIGDVSVSEGNSGTKLATFTVSLSAVSSSSVTYNITTNTNGTATSGVDYVANSLTGQTIPAGQTSKTFNVTINGDTTVEANETYTVGVSNVVGATIVDGTALGTITNDDTASLSIGDVAVTEGNSGTKLATFTVSLNKPSNAAVTYNITTNTNGTATSGVDYVANSLTGQTIPAGQTSKTFSVTINGDTTVEANETYTVGVSNVVGATVTDGTALGTITNDDTASLSVGDVAVTEGNSGTKLATFTVSLDKPTVNAVTYNITTNTNGTATSGVDYVANSLTGQTIPAGQTSKTFNVTINGDTTVEANETYTVGVSNVVGALVGDGSALGTITNDDTASLSIADVAVTEGNSGTKLATFTVSLNKPSNAAVTYNITTNTNGTATSGVDYVANSLTGQTIPAGSTSKPFNVTINGDTTVEANETYTVGVSNVVGAAVSDGTALGTITNDDAGPAPVSIATIQGSGPISPLVGQSVQTDGEVTAITTDGFFLQTPDANRDADRATSEGVFVAFAGARSLAVGQRVEVRGRVDEATVGDDPNQFTLTRILADSVQAQADRQPLPSPVRLDASEVNPNQIPGWLERYEGMRVAIPGLRVVAPVGGRLDEVHATAIGNGRFFGVPTGTARPFLESGIDALDRMSLRAGVTPPVFDGNPELLQIDSQGQIGTKVLAADVGDSISGLVGVLGYGSGHYRLLPDPGGSPAQVSGATPKAVSAPDATQIAIGSVNLRRLFDDRDDPTGNEPVLTSHAYALRLAKIANGLCAYAQSPAIIGVTEVESLATLSDLAAAINSQAGNVLFLNSCKGKPQYRSYLLPGNETGNNVGVLIDTAEIRPGLSRVQMLSVEQIGKDASFAHPDGSCESLYPSPPLRLRARVAHGAGITTELNVVVNQFTAIDGNSMSPASHGWKTQGEYLRGKRSAQALSLARWIDGRQRANAGEKLVVLGDFNAPEFNDGYADVMGVLTGREAAADKVLDHVDNPIAQPLTNLTTLLPDADRYTVTRDGNAEAVDHILVNQALLRNFDAHEEVARINADFGEDNAGDYTVPMRFSDHDPVLLYLQPREVNSDRR